MPYDLSDDTGSNNPSRPDQELGLPTGRASDLLRPPGSGGASPRGGGHRRGGGGTRESFLFSERPITPADGAVRTIFGFSLIALILSLAYLLWGVWTGELANPHFAHQYASADRLRILNDIAICNQVLRISALVTLVSLLFLFYDEESLGYILVAAGVLLDIGVPWISQWLLSMSRSSPSHATESALGAIESLASYAAIPGIILIVWDLVRRTIAGLDQSRERRVSLRYGQGVTVQTKRRNVFLGHCWNTPYCREPIRSRCPIFIKHRGPCWRYKQGCMCEESISKLATNPGEWKSVVTSAITKMEGRDVAAAPARPLNPILGFTDSSGRAKLSWGEKKQRCRECVIYNTHQEQKYKALTACVFLALAAVLFFYNGILIDILSFGFGKINYALGQMSLTNNGGNPVFGNNASVPVCWFILIVLTILLLSKLLQVVEYCCFTIKI